MPLLVRDARRSRADRWEPRDLAEQVAPPGPAGMIAAEMDDGYEAHIRGEARILVLEREELI